MLFPATRRLGNAQKSIKKCSLSTKPTAGRARSETGGTREEKWRGNWRMEWVASTLTPPPNVVYPALLKLMRTPRLPAVDWSPHRFKWTRPFQGKTKSGFCACHHAPHELYNTLSIVTRLQALLWIFNRHETFFYLQDVQASSKTQTSSYSEVTVGTAAEAWGWPLSCS